MSEGLEPAKIDNTDFDSADDDQPLDLDMGNRVDRHPLLHRLVRQPVVGRPRRHQRDGASAGIRQVAAGRLHGERDRPRGGANIFGIISDMCKMLPPAEHRRRQRLRQGGRGT